MIHRTRIRTMGFFLAGWGLAWIACPTAVAESDAGPVVRRPDPRTGNFYAIAADQIIPGKIYSHFNPAHGRYVWAYALPEGGFGYPLGPGSTELPDHFDVTTSATETQALIESAAGSWLQESAREASKIWVRLGADNKWQVVQGRTIRSHFDLATGRRWEWHGPRRVVVGHLHGYLWSYRENDYEPVRVWPHLSQLGK